MSNIAKTYTFVNSQPADGTQVNKNFDDIINGVGDVATLRPTVASLGLDADLTTLALPANTTISPAGAELINDADAAAQIATLGAMSNADATVTYAKMQHVSATDKVLGRSTAGTGDVEEIPCTAAGRALIALANAPAQMAILGAVATTDSRLSDARPASDVSAWAKAGSPPASALFACGSYTGNGAANRAISAGFQPKLVMLFAIGFPNSYRIDATDGRSLVINGSSLWLSPVEAGLVLSATGFVTGNNANFSNVNTTPYRFEAWG